MMKLAVIVTCVTLFVVFIFTVVIFSGTQTSETLSTRSSDFNEKIDGTTGIPLGGVGTGAVKFRSNDGSFAFAVETPCAVKNFKPLENTCLQFFSNRDGDIKTSNKLLAKKVNDRFDDDAIYPLQMVNFGTLNDVDIQMTAFCPLQFENMDLMTNPYAFFEITLKNNLNSAIDTACAFQLGTDKVPVELSGQGFCTQGGLSWALLGDSSSKEYHITYGNDTDFFTKGSCNNILTGKVNKTAVKIRLEANETQTIKFVLSWFQGNDLTRYNYTNRFSDAETVAKKGLEKYESLKRSATDFVWKMRSSNLPAWLKNQTINTLSTLTNNSIYTRDGRYCHTEGQWDINGTMDQMWHARQINIMTMPSQAWAELEYWARTQKKGLGVEGQIHHDFGTPVSTLYNWDDTEHVDYRDIDKWVDLNCGFIISCYEAFIATDDHEKLALLWPYMKKAGQRIFDLTTLYGDKTYPYTFSGTENSYDAGGNPDPFNATMASCAYKVMSILCTIQNEKELQSKYDNAFSISVDSFIKRYLSSNFPQERICESLATGQWIANYLRLGDLYPKDRVAYMLDSLNQYYKPLEKGLGFEKGTYDEWAPYLVGHYGGIALQMGKTDVWRALQYDWYERNYLDRNRVFNQRLDIPSKVTKPNYAAKDFNGFHNYISTPVLWRHYYTIIGYQRNMHTQELSLMPVLPDEMQHTMTNAYYISPEGSGTMSYLESGSGYQNQDITIKPDKPFKVSKIYVKDKYSKITSVEINGVETNYTRGGMGNPREIVILWSGTIMESGLNIVVKGDVV